MTCHLLRVDVLTGEYVRLNIKICFSNLLHHAFCKSRFIFVIGAQAKIVSKPLITRKIRLERIDLIINKLTEIGTIFLVSYFWHFYKTLGEVQKYIPWDTHESQSFLACIVSVNQCFTELGHCLFISGLIKYLYTVLKLGFVYFP